MKVEMWSIDKVRPYEQNPRVNDQAVEAVVNSIREYGFRQPIVVDSEGVIVVGHTRWKAAKVLGLERVPVHVAKDLSPEKAKAYRIADNKVGELADWNYDLLPVELMACMMPTTAQRAEGDMDDSIHIHPDRVLEFL